MRSINGHAMTEFFNSIAQTDDLTMQICSDITFVQPLHVTGGVVVKHATSHWNGVNVAETVGQLKANQQATNYTIQLDQLRSVATSLANQLKSISFVFSICKYLFFNLLIHRS